jgi:hypothetical protein
MNIKGRENLRGTGVDGRLMAKLLQIIVPHVLPITFYWLSSVK